jgi:hypothetical protein
MLGRNASYLRACNHKGDLLIVSLTPWCLVDEGASSSSSIPGNGARKWLDVWHIVDDYYGQAVGKLQAESMMSTTASLFPQ